MTDSNLDETEHEINEDIKEILEKFPFLSYGTMNEIPYLGIIQNCDSNLFSIYILTDIPDKPLRDEFLVCGNTWWWESNRQIPINIFLKEKFKPFRPFLKHFSRKDFILLAGHVVSLQEIIARRVRKRQITLVRRFPI